MILWGRRAAFRWNLLRGTYDNASHDVSGLGANPVGLFFSANGRKMYVTNTGDDEIHEVALDEAWDVSSAAAGSYVFDYSGVDTDLRGIFFKPDGTAMYPVGATNKVVRQYTLSTAWDLSTATYASKFKGVNSQATFPVDVFFSPDGTKMYISDFTSPDVYQYTLSTAWDVSTASYASKTLDASSQDTVINAIFFRPDGKKLYVTGANNGRIYQYGLSTAWDISTATYDSVNLSVNEIHSLFVHPQGTKLWVVGTSGSTVYQYSIT